MTTIWEDKRRQTILNVTLFSLNGTTISESEGAPLTTILEYQGSSFDSKRYGDLGAPVKENAPVGIASYKSILPPHTGVQKGLKSRG